MFSCLWELWDWLDPTSMENKKGVYQNASNNLPPANEQQPSVNEAAIPKHSHQHNTAPQHIRLLQYGLKIPAQAPHAHQQINSPLHLHVHSHNQQLQYQSTAHHRHLQTSPDFNIQNAILQHPQPNQQFIHQHQQAPQPKYAAPLFQNQTLYQTTPPPLHPHSQMVPNTPQIWVPHQPPIHYHQQSNKTESQKSTPTTPRESQAPVKPIKEVVERKKSTGNNSHLRSPAAKRPLEAPVTMQGWLHKQGSEGLMLWKKRWFVLSEYCLFYYKGLEEEKLLGSILLPSYKVSICGPEDKVNKKFAFKCEHANMRTYILAADSQELMLQWIRVLNLACLLQTNSENPQTTPEILEPTYQQHHNNRTTPVHTHSSSNTTDMSNPSQQELCQYNQPLYANAPPKPRRLNDGSYSSPSPEILDRYPNLQYGQPRNIAKSPVNYNIVYNQPDYVTLQPHRPKHKTEEYLYSPSGEVHLNIPQNTERRTPDTYGRSKLNPGKPRQLITDYEDVYADQFVYKRPLSPIAHSHVIKKSNPTINAAYRSYTPVNMIGPKDVPVQMRKSPSSIARPHSADFLEYEINHRQLNSDVLNKQQPRPKSSLDINRSTNDSDNYFYSEERYAEKMRKSAQYLHKMPRGQQFHPEFKPTTRYADNDNTFPLMRSNTQPMNFNNLQLCDMQPIQQPTRSRSVLSEGSLSKELDIDLRTSPRERMEKQSMSPYNYHPGTSNSRNKEYDHFTRSASARLAQTTPQNERMQEDRPVNREGDRKREESMKRLLEWKQRMLQSPLNRKVQGNRCYPGRQDYYHPSQENEYLQHQAQKYMDGRRSVTNLPQYNSYSSDDEENQEGSKDNVHSQAGWTLDTFPNKTDSLTPAHITSTTVLNTLKEPDKPFNLTLDKIKYNTSNPQGDFEEHSLTKPLKQFNKESSNLAHVSSLKSEYSGKFEQSPSVTEIKSNGALVKSILAEFEKEKEASSGLNTPTNDLQAIIEENYMTMTPKKSVLDPMNTVEEPDENPYVEMTQNLNNSILNDMQPYEIVCFSEGRLEPVYMELKQPVSSKFNQKDLPDILLSPQRNPSESCKSDSSDADDEASKDLDSLDTPSQPRFSLSDSFRPASYYLGASQTVPEYHDSSDSELVSPPPIPTSPPPLDDLESLQSKKDESYGFLPEKNPEFFPSDLEKKQGFLYRSNEPDTSSMCSTNTDPERKYSNSRLSHNSDSDIEVRLPRMLNFEDMLKRRPLSEEFCDEIESMNQSINDSVDLDRYLRDLENSNLSLNGQDIVGRNHDYENMFVNEFVKKAPVKPSEVVSVDSSQVFEDFLQRASARPNSSASTSAEICGLLRNSNCSTPSIRLNSSLSIQEVPTVSSYFSDSRDKSSNLSFGQTSAPYYYSDLSVNTSHSAKLTLNNQRGVVVNSNKKDITHIINPIKEPFESAVDRSPIDSSTFKLAAEARSVSVDFLNLTDKSGHIDKKNIYESDTLKRQKALDSSVVLPLDTETRNLYPMGKGDKFNSTGGLQISNGVEIGGNLNVRRTHSLEGLLENVLSDAPNQLPEEHMETPNASLEGSYLWEEDSIWRERLRSASQRHSKSMENLDCIGEAAKKNQRKSPRGITRGVTYVNDNLYNMPPCQEKDVEKSKNEIKKEGSFLIDREKLRQWDLLSSAPSENQLNKAIQEPRGNNTTVVELGQGSCESTENANAPEAASGSITINTRDSTFPRAMSSKKIWASNARSQTNLNKNIENEQNMGRHQQPGYFINKSSSQHELNAENLYARKETCSTYNDKMNVSAGELLGRTHEELVLLLIQLRRQSAHTLQAIENSYNEIDTIQAQLHMMDQARRIENLQKLEQIKQHLLELEKQYEKGKPLVNLVDNMVKLGSLYRIPTDRNNIAPYIRDRLEFNQQIQERRLLAEEKRDWNRLTPNHIQLQEKVQQLYQLDRLIQEESSILQNLQKDKEDIERALGGLRHRLNKGFSDPAEVEQARKQQILLENELSRVHLMLAKNSKKLEETVAGNARLEQELLVLKQKLQTSRQQRSSPQFSNAGDSLPCVVGSSAILESDLQKVQKKIGDLQKQRHELSMQVRQLTDRSNNMFQMKTMSSSALQNNQCNKRKVTSLWRETDLDTMNIIDHGDSWNTTTPLYINTDIKQTADADYYNRTMKSSDSTSDDATQNMNLPSEKQEIKTVRIVKRESERRQRDREKTTTGKWDALVEEDDSSQSSSILFRPSLQKTNSSTAISSGYDTMEKSSALTRQSSISTASLPQLNDSSTDLNSEKSPELSPIFKSEAARQIITEMSIQDVPKQTPPNKRAVPKEKRRHYTAPHNNLIMKSLHQLPTDESAFNKLMMNSRRARDDMDMERALRQRIDAPDVVRSTLSNKELKYNESTIDNILGTPNKINIPERYIPEQLPQLSAEEQEYRLRKVESIKKMLSDTTIISGSSSSSANPSTDDKNMDKLSNSFTSKATTKMIEEKKQREHLLQLNQILAKQVMEMSKIVAVKALAKLPLQSQEINNEDDEDSSPVTPLPLYQQRDNFYS